MLKTIVAKVIEMAKLFQNNLTVSSNVKTFFIIYFIKNAEFQFQTNGTKSKNMGVGEP
jgi:hypothetical protein